MKCPECVSQGLRSCVTVGGSMTTAMIVSQYYDKDGNLHIHDRNKKTQYYRCSNGHQFSESWKSPCPSCDFGKAV